jgi:hypothetical protein
MLPFQHGIQSLWQRKLSSGLTSLTFTFFAVGLILTGSLRSFNAPASPQPSRLNQFFLLQKGAPNEMQSAIREETFRELAAWPEIAQDDQHVPLISAEYLFAVNIKMKNQAGQKFFPITLRGLRSIAKKLRPGVTITKGRWFRPGTQEIIMGVEVSRRLPQLDIGSSLPLGGKNWQIVGIFAAPGDRFQSEIWGDRDLLGASLGHNFFQSITLRLAAPIDAQEAKKRLETRTVWPIEIWSESEFSAAQHAPLADTIRIIRQLSGIILAIFCLMQAIHNTMASICFQRQEIGMLLILGFSPGQLLVSYVWQSIILGVIGAGGGILITGLAQGMHLGCFYCGNLFPLEIVLDISGRDILGSLLFSILIAAIGGAIPAIRLFYVRILELIGIP